MLPAIISDGVYGLLNARVVANEAHFYVYQDADSGFTRGFPSGFFAGASSAPREAELIASISLDLACVDAPFADSGCSTDPAVVDRDRGTVARVTLPSLNPQEFVGVAFEEPEGFSAQPEGRGYDLRGAQRVVLDARSPTPGGIRVQFGVGGRVTNYSNFFALDNTFRSITVDLATLRDPITNLVSPPNLADVHLLFSVSTDFVHAPNGGTILIDNVRFEPVPTNPTGGERLSFPVGNETFGVVPARVDAVDNGDADFAVVGGWSAEADTNSYLGDRHTISANAGTSTALWTFGDLEPRFYVVQATWAPTAGNATNAPFEVFDGTEPRSAALVDQTMAPAGLTFDGRVWQTIGSVTGDEISSGTLNVQLSNNGVNGLAVADGVRIVPTIPPDQAIRNLTTVYESALTVISLIDRGTPEDLANARVIADTLVYALEHDNTGGGGALPKAPDGARGLHDAYSSGDIALLNDQGPGANDAKAGQARISGFSSDPRLCGPSGFCLVLDGAFGGNNAFGIMALMDAYFEFGDAKYFDAASEIGNWIYGNLVDPNGPSFDAGADPGAETFGGYFLGYPDQGASKNRVNDLIRGKSIENNADIFSAFSMLSAAERQLGNTATATEWTQRANIAGDFVMALFDPGDPDNPRDGHFYPGTLFDRDEDGPAQPPTGPGLEPSDRPEHRKGIDVINLADILDSSTFTTLALARSARYRDRIDWREPVRFIEDTFAQEITATTGGQAHTFKGFNIVPQATSSQFRPGGPIGGLPQGIAWEFTAQVVLTMRFVDRLYGVSEFEVQAQNFLDEIAKAQTFAPFGDGRGLVAATLDGENDAPGTGYAPLDQCLGTPFQCIAERVGLAATNWAIYADQDINVFSPQLPLPVKVGETFVVEDWNNKLTENDLGFNYAGGNAGTVNEPSTEVETTQVTKIDLSADTPDGEGESLSVNVNFDRAPNPPGEFGGLFMSLFGLTDTLVSLDGSGQQPSETTPFPGYFVNFDDYFQGFGSFADRTIDMIAFDLKREPSSAPFVLKIELKDENGFDAFARVTVGSTDWARISLGRTDINSSIAGQGDASDFDWTKVSVLSLIVERQIFDFSTGNPLGTNPTVTGFFIDNVTLVDTDGQYPDLDPIENPDDGELDFLYEDAFLDYVRETSARYFVDFASTDPRTGGISQDRSPFADLMTVGGGGFQLSSYVIDAERDYLSRQDAAQRTLSILRTLHDLPQGPEPVGTIGYQGFFYHFLGIDGLRKQNFDRESTKELNEAFNTVELSTIDTALALAGVLTSRQYFNSSDPLERQIRLLGDSIYERVNWRFLLEPASNQFYLGWKPNEMRDDDSGRFGRFKINDADGRGQYSSKDVDGEELPATIDFYTDEGLLIALLAMGAPNPNHRVGREVWDAMIRAGDPFVKSFPGSLFTYEFASLWLDTELLGTDNHEAINNQPARPVNFFHNSRSAILATREYAIANPNDRATWRDSGGANRWGLSAAEGPYDDYFAHAAPTAALANDAGFVSGPASHSTEAETGVGDGSPMFRSNASGGRTVQLDDGESRTLTINLQLPTQYEVVVRYSNDNFGPLETVTIAIDGTVIGSFQPQDTGDFGFGWNNFLDSDSLGPVSLCKGDHDITISVAGGDGFGVEIDKVTVQHGDVFRPLEGGTVTAYGAGAAIQHAPEHAIPALWEARQLDLIHPRFGAADAFNLDICGVIPPDEPGSEILRMSGPWANFTGFAIDHGPMVIAIDNYLHGKLIPQTFMSYRTIRASLEELFPNVDLVIPPFQDRFEQPDGARLNHDWVEEAGSFRTNGRQVEAVTLGASLAVVNGVSEVDVAISAAVSVNANAGHSVGLVARYTGPVDRDFYLAWITGVGGTVTASIYRNLAGIFTQLKSSTLNSATGVVRFEVTGSSLKLYFNDELVLVANDTSLTQSGSVGIRAFNSTNVRGAIDDFTAVAIMPQNESLPFTDDFNQPSDQLSPSWAHGAGHFVVRDNQVTSSLTGASLTTVNGISATNASVSAKFMVNPLATHSVGLLARYTGSLDRNYYLAWISGVGGTTTARIYKNVNGSFTLLSTKALASNAGLARFEVVGGSLTLFIDGAFNLSAYDGTLTQSGSVGIRAFNTTTTGGTLDDFAANEIQLPEETLPFTDDFNQGSNQLSHSWMQRAGHFGVQADAAQAIVTGSSLATVNGVSAADVAVAANFSVTPTASHSVGLVARYGGPFDRQYYLAWVSGVAGNVTASVYRNLGGTFTVLNSARIAKSVGLLRFEVVGTSLKLFVDGQLIVFAHDSLISQAGSIGIRAFNSVHNAGILDNFSAPAIAIQNETLPFGDTFNQTSTELSRSWSESAGRFAVQDDQAVASFAGASLATVNGISAADVAISATIEVNPFGAHSVGLVARHTGPADRNYYLAWVSGIGGTVRAWIFRNVNGAFTLLSSKLLGSNEGSGQGDLRFEVEGVALRLFFNNVLMVQAVDGVLSQPGSVGTRAFNVDGVLDDFLAVAL